MVIVANILLYSFVLAIVFLFGAFVASVAQAEEPEWLLNGASISTAHRVKTKWVIIYTDSKGGLFGEKQEIECRGTDEGTVGPGGVGKITKFVTTSCVVRTSFCPTPADATAVHLPWQTSHKLVGTEIRTTISNGGSGEPGWQISCNGFVEDECTGETSTHAVNVVNGVEELFDGKSAKANCTRGGSGAGTLLGFDLYESPAGETLAVS